MTPRLPYKSPHQYAGRCWDCGELAPAGVCMAEHRPGSYIRGKAIKNVEPSRGTADPNAMYRRSMRAAASSGAKGGKKSAVFEGPSDTKVRRKDRSARSDVFTRDAPTAQDCAEFAAFRAQRSDRRLVSTRSADRGPGVGEVTEIADERHEWTEEQLAIALRVCDAYEVPPELVGVEEPRP